MKPLQIPNVLAALTRDHANISKLLELLESEILAIEVGKTPDQLLLQNIMRYMTQYPDRFHHPKEDLVFAQLVKRDPGARADVDVISKQHTSIGQAGQNFDRLLRTSVVDSVNMREGLRVAGLSYIRALYEHMAIEETKLFPLAVGVLTEEDWQNIEEKLDASEDPLFGDTVAEDYERLYDLIADRQPATSYL